MSNDFILDILYLTEYKLEATKQYNRWFKKLRPSLDKIKILARLSRMENGNFGDHKQLSGGFYELRFFFGSGFRIYYTIKCDAIILLLIGGDKSSQQKDIDKAESLLKEMED